MCSWMMRLCRTKVWKWSLWEVVAFVAVTPVSHCCSVPVCPDFYEHPSVTHTQPLRHPLYKKKLEWLETKTELFSFISFHFILSTCQVLLGLADSLPPLNENNCKCLICLMVCKEDFKQNRHVHAAHRLKNIHPRRAIFYYESQR